MMTSWHKINLYQVFDLKNIGWHEGKKGCEMKALSSATQHMPLGIVINTKWGESILFLEMPVHLLQIRNMLYYPLQGKWICWMLHIQFLCSLPIIYLKKIVRNQGGFLLALLILASVKHTTSGEITSTRNWWMTPRKRKDIKEVWLSEELIKIKIWSLVYI